MNGKKYIGNAPTLPQWDKGRKIKQNIHHHQENDDYDEYVSRDSNPGSYHGRFVPVP